MCMLIWQAMGFCIRTEKINAGFEMSTGIIDFNKLINKMLIEDDYLGYCDMRSVINEIIGIQFSINQPKPRCHSLTRRLEETRRVI